MAKLNFNQAGYTPTEETINQPISTWFALEHDVYTDIEVWTGAGKTSSQLVEGVNYERGINDTATSGTYTSGFGEEVTGAYTQLRLLTNGGVDLYVWARYHGDLVDTTDFVQTSADNTFTGVQTFDTQFELQEIATPSSPAGGYRSMYAKSDGIYEQNSAGTEAKLMSALGVEYANNFDFVWREDTENYEYEQLERIFDQRLG